MWEQTESRVQERRGEMRGHQEKCHSVLEMQYQVTQKETRDAKRQETREDGVEQRSRKGNWGDKKSQERTSGDEM